MSLLLDNYTIELSDESNLAITKSIYDVIEPDKRKTSFSKTITIPSTPQNDKVLMGMFDVNFSLDSSDQFDPFFNPSKKAPCYMHTETLEQMTGYAQLTDIVLNHYTNKVEYKLTLYGEVRDLFGTLADRKLSELDLSEFNHIYNKDNIVDSWDNNIYRNGVLTASEMGVGYVYPQVDYGDDHQKWNGSTLESSDYWRVEHFRPWVYVKTIVDQIFKEADFSYYSTFFNSDLFSKLIFQGDINGLQLDAEEVSNLSVGVHRGSDKNYTLIANNWVDGVTAYSSRSIDFDVEDYDVSGDYDNATRIYTAPYTTKYRFGFDLGIEFTNNDAYTWNMRNPYIKIVGVKSDGSIVFTHTLGVSTTTNVNAGTQYLFNSQSITEEFWLVAGDLVKVCVLGANVVNLSGSNPAINIGLKIQANSTLAIQPVSQLPVGGMVNISQMLSSDMTQKDFLMGLVKMFNLYIEPYWFRTGDTNSGKYAQYLIETRDEYFTEDVIDWTSNLDLEKDFTIRPMALSKYKYYNFSYKEDNDYLNARYKGETGRIYGDYLHFIDNDFSKETSKIEIPFSPAIVGQFYSTGRVIPIIKQTGGGVRKDGKPKILFYQGNLGTSALWNFEGEVQSNCPYAGQLDSQSAPTCDLNFKVPAVLYYSGDVNGEITLTSSTLFNKYYYRQIFEMNDKNSKMVECYMRLRPSDIHNVSFRPLYFIKNAYYRLYEIVDHNYQDTTLCRFLKINVVNPIDNANYITKGGRGVFGTLGDKLPTKASPTEGESAGGFGTPVGSRNGGVVMGGDTSGERVTKGLLGTGILQGGQSTTVIAKDNIIDFGFNYLNISSGSTTINGDEGSPLYILADTTAGDINLYLPDETINLGKLYVVNKIPASHLIYVYDFADVLVHTISSAGACHHFLLTEDGVIMLQ